MTAAEGGAAAIFSSAGAPAERGDRLPPLGLDQPGQQVDELGVVVDEEDDGAAHRGSTISRETVASRRRRDGPAAKWSAATTRQVARQAGQSTPPP